MRNALECLRNKRGVTYRFVKEVEIPKEIQEHLLPRSTSVTSYIGLVQVEKRNLLKRYWYLKLYDQTSGDPFYDYWMLTWDNRFKGYLCGGKYKGSDYTMYFKKVDNLIRWLLWIKNGKRPKRDEITFIKLSLQLLG